MSASAIADGLLANLSAASVLGNGNVSKNSYQTLESSACQAAVIHWARLTSEPITFGNPRDRQRTWGFTVECYLRDLGDPVQLLNRVWSLTDTVINSLESDETLQGTCSEMNTFTAAHDSKSALNIGGQTWLTFDLNLEIIE